MIAHLRCSLCGVEFGGRADAIYCSSACRQKAHRVRTARRIAAMAEQQRSGPRRRPMTVKPDIAVTIERAQREQRRARELCRAAAATQRQILASQRRTASRGVARAPGEVRP